jgi:hypothetical protein
MCKHPKDKVLEIKTKSQSCFLTSNPAVFLKTASDAHFRQENLFRIPEKRPLIR